MNRRTYYNRTGKFMVVTDSFSRAAEKRLVEHFGDERAYMRMGHYSVVVGPEDVVAAKAYDEAMPASNWIGPNSKFWDSHVRDRKSQMQRVEDALKKCPQHPLYKELMNDIALEREMLALGRRIKG